MLKIFAGAAVMGLFAATAAYAASADETALAIAKQRGYTAEQTACFMKVAKTYAVQDASGNWTIPMDARTKAGDDYRAEMHKQCNISR